MFNRHPSDCQHEEDARVRTSHLRLYKFVRFLTIVSALVKKNKNKDDVNQNIVN